MAGKKRLSGDPALFFRSGNDRWNLPYYFYYNLILKFVNYYWCFCFKGMKRIFEVFLPVNLAEEIFSGIFDSYVYHRVDKEKGGGLTDEKDFIERLKQGNSAGAEILMQQYKPLLTYLISPILSVERDREEIGRAHVRTPVT